MRKTNYRKIYRDSSFYELGILDIKTGYVEAYLEAVRRVFLKSMRNYRRIFAFRVDLREPENITAEQRQRLVERFVASFKYRIYSRLGQKRKARLYPANTEVRYVWARERASEDGHIHYHFGFLLNKDAFFTIGQYEPGRANIYNDLVLSWASALGIPPEQGFELIHIPRRAEYRANGRCSELSDAFKRFSYLAKAATKYRDGCHAFGTSRN